MLSYVINYSYLKYIATDSLTKFAIASSPNIAILSNALHAGYSHS